ncbi:MAG: hypothetical protein K2Q09_06525 [Phycisphaerales bacterium]|nr:hypothetical protein [Phycisphaerales bacterium]
MADNRSACAGGVTYAGLDSAIRAEVLIRKGCRDLVYEAQCGATIPFGYYRVVRNTDTTAGASRANRLRGGLTYDTTAGQEVENATFAHYFRFICSYADLGATGGVTAADGYLDNNDFIAFIKLYFASDPRADLGVAGGLVGTDGLFNNNDFVAFISLFFDGQANCTGPYQRNCFGRPGGGNAPSPAPASGGEGLIGGGRDGLLAGLRQALETMIANETDAARRARLQEMLDALPPVP